MQTISTARADEARRDQDTSSLVLWGWVTAILLAPVGFVLGGILASKGRVGQGVAIMCVAVLLTASLLLTV